MKTFKQYLMLNEAAKANTHLTHLEELILKQGQSGYNTARKFITDLLNHLETNSGRVGTTVKWDGAPAIFVGINPENGKFFVGTKSIFNINPKFNYTAADVDLNHGNAPGLADKLKKALIYLPQLGIKNILQGDFMFDDSSIQEETIDGVSHLTFKPNTIKYAVETDSELGRKIAKSKFGVIFHTEYDDLGGGARFGAKVDKLNTPENVWFDDAFFKDDTGVVTLTQDEVSYIKDILKNVDSIKVDYDNLPLDLLNIYTNVEIKEGEYLKDPETSYNRFVTFISNRKDKEIEKRKTEAGKKKIGETYDRLLSNIDKEKDNIVNLFKVSKHLSDAKQIFINKYNNAVYKTKHFIDGGDGTLKVTSPEGYVAIDRDGSAVKLVDRLEFSRANFMAGKPGDKSSDEENYITNPPTRGDFYGKGRFSPKSDALSEDFNTLYSQAMSDTETVALYPGGYKPPTKGHYHSFDYILQDADKGIIFIGKNERDGITAEQSKEIWEVYAKYMNKPVEVVISDVTPVKSVYEFADENKDINIIVGAGAKDEDIKRYAYFEKNIDKYPLVRVVKIPIQSEGISGTKTRELIAQDIDKAIEYFVPSVVSAEDKSKIRRLLR